MDRRHIRVTPCFSFGISYKSSFGKTIIPCSSLALLAGSANSRESVTVEDEREVEDDIVGDNEVGEEAEDMEDDDDDELPPSDGGEAVGSTAIGRLARVDSGRLLRHGDTVTADLHLHQITHIWSILLEVCVISRFLWLN